MRKNINLNSNKFLSAQTVRFCLLMILLLAPTTANAQGSAPTSRTTGSPAGAYQLSGFDTVNLFGGNLNFNLPLLGVGGRGEVSQGISLTLQTQWGSSRTDDVNGNIYYEMFPTVTNQIASVGYLTAEGDNASLDYQSPCNSGDGTIFYLVNHQFHLTFVEADGTEHKLVDRISRGRPFGVCGDLNINYGRLFESVGGEFISFISDADVKTLGFQLTGYLYFKNGVQSRIEGGQILWSKDRNGNKIEYTYHPNYNLPFYIPRPTKIKDSIGREINIEYDVNESAPYGTCDRIIYKGSGGQERIIRASKDWLRNNLRTSQISDSSSVKTIGELFPESPPNYRFVGNKNDVFDSAVMSAVWLPDGRSYKFKYSVYGRLAQVELPTGGVMEYDFEPNADSLGNYDTVLNRVKEKRVYKENNILETKTIFAMSFPLPSDNVTGGTVVTVENFDADNHRLSKSRHLFYGGPGGDHSYNLRWTDGKEYRTETYDSDGSTLLRRVEMNWKQRTPSWCNNYPYGGVPCGLNPPETAPISNPFILETKETLADGNLVKLTSSINPTTGEWAIDAFNNVTDVWEYDYGIGQPGQFLRRTHTDYHTGTNYTNYGSSYLPSLPTQIWVSSNINGTTKASLTQFEYDNYSGGGNASLIPRTNVVGHDAAYDSSHTSRGNLTRVIKYGNAQNQSEPISIYTNYDVLGNVVKTYDANGNSSTINYNDNFGSPDGNLGINTTPAQLNGQSTFAFPTSATNPLEWTSYAQFDYFTGQVVDAEDINGVVNSTFYDDLLDRPTKRISANNQPNFRHQTKIIYDDDLQDRTITILSDLSRFDDKLLKSESVYDGLGRTIEARKYESDGGYVATKSIPFLVEQDSDTQVWRAASKVSNPYRPLVGEQPVWTTSLSDALGRSIKVITPDGAKVKTDYTGNVVTVTDQALKQRRSITNALGHLIRVDEPNNAGQLGDVSSPNQPTNYSYDVLNNLLEVEQIGNNSEECGGTTSNCSQTRTFVYDSLSRLKQATNPESGLIQYSYDNNGNLLSKIDARQVTTTYQYDALNRVWQRSYNDNITPAVTYIYDNVVNAKGKLTKVSSSVSETRYTSFDILGRVTASEQRIPFSDSETAANAEPRVSTYTYNLSGALIEQTYPSGRVVKNVLDNNGDLETVQSKKNANYGFWNYAQNFTYTAAGAVSSMQLGNFRWESTQFNSRLQPKQIALGTVQYSPQTIAQATNILKLDYTYNTVSNGTPNADNNGNVLSQTITVPTVGNDPGFTAVQNYTYDSLNRLKVATEDLTPSGGTSVQTWKQTFTFDRYGNRNFDEANTTTIPRGCGTEQNPNTTICDADRKAFNPAINTSDNRLSTADGYNFDLSGNTTRDSQNRKFTYDGENKQIKVETVDQNGTVTGTLGEYWYDGDGKRVKKYSFENSEWMTTIFIYDASGKLIEEYSTKVETTNAKVSYLTNDHLGSPRITTDRDGQTISRRDFQPFGEEIATSQRTQGLGYTEDTIRQKFTGYIRDEETDLDFAQARYFNSGFGRFSSPDDFLNDTSTWNPANWNLYTYVGNNPLKYIDPTGEEIWIAYEETEEYEEDGVKKKRQVTRIAQYKDGKLWTDYKNKKEYSGTDKNVLKVVDDLSKIDPDLVKKLANDNLFHGISTYDSGNDQIKGSTMPDGGGYEAWERNGNLPTGSLTTYDPNNPEDDESVQNRTTAATLERELRVASDFADGNYFDYDPYRYRTYDDDPGVNYQRSEITRMTYDNVARRSFNLPERKYFGNQRIPKGNIICEWSTRTGMGGCR